MTGNLDRFSPASWHEDGVLKVESVRKSQPKRQQRKAQPLVTAVAVSLACVGVSSAVVFACDPTGATHIVAQREVAVIGTTGKLEMRGDFVSPSSWPDIMATIENAPGHKIVQIVRSNISEQERLVND